MEIKFDPNSSFCFGVVYAIDIAESILKEEKTLNCLGDIVHNEEEINRLKNLGLKIITHEDLKNLKDSKVLIRAHGEPPETYRIANENNLELIDASCPVVLKLQNRITKGVEKNKDLDSQIVIYGQENHAEVIGLSGQTNNKAIIIYKEEDYKKIDFNKPIILYSQTTKSYSGLMNTVELLSQKFIEHGKNPDEYLKLNDTLCRQVSNREKHLEKFSKENELIIFVGGTKSSNGKALYSVCKINNPKSYYVSNINEINKEWFEGVKSIGISGATSTPFWLMKEISEKIKSLLPDM